MNPTRLFPRLRPFAAKSPIALVKQACASPLGASFVLALAILVAAATPQTASAQAVTYAGPGAVNFGSANVCPSGKTAPAPCSQTLTLTYNVTATGTLGTPKALATGQPNLDYKLAGGSTCSGSVSKGNTCTVNVTFAPIAPGQRMGAVEIVDASNNVLATTYIYGSGVGPLVSFAPPTQRSIGNGYGMPIGIAVDAAGNVFVADLGAEQIREVLAVDGSIPEKPVQKILATGVYPYTLALDGAGNILYEDINGSIREFLAVGGYSTLRVLNNIPNHGGGNIAIDGSGNLFLTTNGNSVLELPAAGNYSTFVTLGGGFAFTATFGIAVDASGNVFVADLQAPDGQYAGVVYEILASGNYTTVRTFHVSNAQNQGPIGVAVDAAGDLFVGFHETNTIAELSAVNGVLPANPMIQRFGSAFYVQQMAADNLGNIYAVDYASVQELQLSTPPPLNFAATVLGGTSSDSPQSIRVQNRGNASLDATSLAVSGPNWLQVAGSGAPEDCASSFTLVSAAECNLSISFKPAEQGFLTGAATLVDNSLNAPGSAQSAVLSGTGVAVPHIASLNTTYGAPYSVVILNGTDFGATQGSSAVTFNGIPSPHYNWSDTRIYVTVPIAATTGNIVVTAYGTASNAIPFTVLPQPVITGISPTSGTAGTVVTITGNNLLDYENRASVTFDGKSLPIISDTSAWIKVAAPPGTGTGVFHVLVNDTGMNTPAFTYEQAIVGTGPVNVGTANVCPPGSASPAPCSQTVAVTFNVLVNATLGTPLALTASAPNLDFKLASGSTCAGAVTGGSTCTVNIAFAPIAPGVRKGAIEITDTSGDVLATTLVSATGIGPLIGFLPGQPRTLGTTIGGSGYVISSTVATDGSGDVFVTDPNSNNPILKEFLAVDGVIPDNPVVKVLLAAGSGYFPTALAVDGAGNVFFADNDEYYPFHNSPPYVREILAAGGYTTIRTLPVSFGSPASIAVDRSGNLFVVDQNKASVTEVFAATGYATSKKLGGDFNAPSALALDSNDNLFVAVAYVNESVGAVYELPASGGYSTVNPINIVNAQGPLGLAIDPAGNLFALFNGVLMEYLAVDGVLPATPATLLVDSKIGAPDAIAIDGRGDLYLATSFYATKLLQELPFSSPSLTFADTYVGKTGSDSPQSIQIQNQGNATGNVTSISFNSSNWYQVPGSGTPADCPSSGFSIIAGAGCDLSIAFRPAQKGSLTGAVAVVDNSLNAAGATQSVSLSGEGITVPPPQIASLSRAYGAPYSVVTVTGAGFGAAQGSSSVTFSGVPATASSWSNTSIVVSVPPTAVTGNVLVTVGGEASNATPFTVLPMPKVTGISPTSGLVGTVVAIN